MFGTPGPEANHLGPETNMNLPCSGAHSASLRYASSAGTHRFETEEVDNHAPA
jgi:hypothetical protein